ncbi:probable RNA-binding protein 18 [Phtheirospermum japonicum]|uniref:Probable RNA-binding protein 18 n=1 Tax=Phtheirospermum japonicum TaxID=374723 RepID=A0A830C7T2_9LAMI|nr:probable RNA-binding protein 18 [Phtheirospermum japonicum]
MGFGPYRWTIDFTVPLNRRAFSPLEHGISDLNNFNDEKSESRLYVGNLDLRITEAALIKMFSSFGKIISEDFLWHTRGPKRGEPRGYAFIQFSTKETPFFKMTITPWGMSKGKIGNEAIRAKEKMHGRMACGRPLVVRLASEKYPFEGLPSSSKSVEGSKSGLSGGGARVSRIAKIAAIKNKLKAMDEEGYHKNLKKQKQADKPCADSDGNPSSER